MPTVDPIEICNLALGELPSDVISTLEDPSVASEWCARSYAPTLAELLDAHDWRFPRERRALALVTNDRPAEWAYAYAVPNDCIQELRVLPTFSASTETVPLLIGQAYAPWMVGLLPVAPMYRYIVSGRVLYSNIEAAVLEFIKAEPSSQTFRPLFRRAFVLQLAARLCMPVIKDRVRQGDLIKMAEVATDRAIADEINRDDSQSSYGNFTNETELARAGASGLIVGSTW